MNHNLTIGINLNNRTLTNNIPDNTTVSELKYIVKVNDDNYIAENIVDGVSKCYFHYIENGEDVDEIFYSSDGTNINKFTLPENFGTITEIDESAELYQYITRVSHEKVYVIDEDLNKRESMDKEQIEANVDKQVRGYGVIAGSVLGWDSEDEIPGGYEKTNLATVEVNSSEPDAEVWIKKGKNLFNLDKLLNVVTNHGMTQKNNSSISITTAGNYGYSRNYIKLPEELLNKQITLSFNAISNINGEQSGIRNSIYVSTTDNESGDILLQLLSTTNTRYSITFVPTVQDVYITLYGNLSDALTVVTITMSDIQLEQNATATDYEPYVEKEIYVKNNNGVFEKFINVDEKITSDRIVMKDTGTTLESLINNLFKTEVGLNGIDLNDLWDRGTGFFDVRNVPANSPVSRSTNNHWHVIQYKGYQSNYGIQIALYFFTSLENIYIRKKIEGNWSYWYQVSVTQV